MRTIAGSELHNYVGFCECVRERENVCESMCASVCECVRVCERECVRVDGTWYGMRTMAGCAARSEYSYLHAGLGCHDAV